MKRKIMAILLAGGVLLTGVAAYAADDSTTQTDTGTTSVTCPYVGDRLKELADLLRSKGKDSIADRIESGEYNNRREAITAVPEETEEIIGALQEEGLAGGGQGRNAGQGLGNGTGVRKLDGTGRGAGQGMGRNR